jgi:hypothetical protein
MNQNKKKLKNSLAQILPKGILAIVLLFSAFTFEKAVKAQQIRLGGQMGALGAGDFSGLGYGIFLGVIPYDQIGFMIDATFASIDDSSYFSSSPSLVFYLSSIDELKIGVLGGGGFYKFEGIDLKFGLNAGATLDFMVANNLWVGSQIRYHSVFNVDSASPVWNVFLNLSYTFDGADGGW